MSATLKNLANPSPAPEASAKLATSDLATVNISGEDVFLLRNLIDRLAHDISKCWLDMSPEAQQRAMELESSLSALRKWMV